MFKNDTDKLDQHFLVDDFIIKKFVNECNLSKSDVVVEVGPGKGQITKIVSPKVKSVYCIELDTKLKEYLDGLNLDNVTYIYSNVLKTYIPKCNKIITALPYSIIEPFMEKLTKCEFDEAIMITGKRFSDSVINNEINKLALLTNSFFDVKHIIDIEPEAFQPKPRVWSSMIKLTPRLDGNLDSFYDFIIKYLFKYKKKNVKNAIIEAIISCYKNKSLSLTKRQSKQILVDSMAFCEIDEVILKKVFSTCSNVELEQITKLVKEIEYHMIKTI